MSSGASFAIPAQRRRAVVAAASLAGAVLLGAPGAADAAQAARNPAEPLDLRRPIDQGLADRNPLGTSLRSLPQAIDDGRSFGRLYADPTRPGRFLRRQGGLAAVFPQSVYVGEGADGVPIVPPGTVFELGWDRAPEAASPRVADRPLPRELVPPGENRLDPKVFLAPESRWDRGGESGDGGGSGRTPRPATAGFGDPLAAFEASGEASGRLADRVRPRFLRDRAYRVRRLDDLFGRAVAVSLAKD